MQSVKRKIITVCGFLTFIHKEHIFTRFLLVFDEKKKMVIIDETLYNS